MPLPKPGESPLYAGTWDCAVKSVQREGFKGLYKGNDEKIKSPRIFVKLEPVWCFVSRNGCPFNGCSTHICDEFLRFWSR